MKKLLLMFTAIFAVVGLVGCGNEGTSGNTSKNSNKVDDGRVEIKLWQDNDKYAEAIIPKIEEALPHIKIVYEKVATGGAAEKLDLDGPAGLGPDIMWNTPESMAKAMQSGILLPLGEKLSTSIQERALDGSVQSVTANDTVYGLPISVESLALVYNKTLLEENGLEVATTFEQIIKDSKTYNDFKNNKFLLRFQSWETYHSLIFLTAAGYELFGPDGYDIDSVNLNTPEVIEGLIQLQKVQEILPIPSKELTWETVNGEFVKGLVPYMITGPWAFEDIQKINEEDKFEWGVTTIPTINGNQPRTFLGNITATISAYTKHPEEAREVLEFMG
ncbi:MAG: extracellular solute-binding protein, partial [Turicibacter sp.]